MYWARKWMWLWLPFTVPVALILLHPLYATAWSNRCDPDNAHFFAMKNDPVTSFHAPGQLYTWVSDSPDNSWMCVNPSLSVSHVGPEVNAMFDATRVDMTQNGWSERYPVPGEDFAVYEKTIDGLQIEATVSKEAFWVEVHLDGPQSSHLGEMGF